MTDYGLGRIEDPEQPNAARLYPMRTTVGVEPFVGVKRWWDSGLWADQGATGTCVGHGWAHYVEDSPITPVGSIDPFLIYREACAIDEWSGNDGGDLDFGTSVRAGAEVLRMRGIVSIYLWALPQSGDGGLQDVINAVGRRGPVVVGTDWLNSMFEPRYRKWPDGYYRKTLVVDPNSGAAGGHCWLINGVDTTNRFFRMKNSWGQSWGAKGRAHISFDGMRYLLNQAGEACIATQKAA